MMIVIVTLLSLFTAVNLGLFIFLSNFILRVAERVSDIENFAGNAVPKQAQQQRERALVDVQTPGITYDPRFSPETIEPQS